MPRSTTLSASVRLERGGASVRPAVPGGDWRGAELLVAALASDYAGELAGAAA